MVSNRAPAAQGSIPATPPLDVGASAHQVDVAAYFSDPDGDALTYRARSSQETVATVRTAGSTVSITPRAKGTATITVTATDPGNLTATQQFRVTVRNRPPQPQGSIPATPPLDAGGAAHQVDVAAYFSDPDGDALTYRARSSQETVATVRTAGSIVSITPRAKGTATITVTAADPGGLRAEQTFDVEVRQESTPRGDPTPAAPVARGSIPDVRLSIGASAHQVDVAAYFSDPNGDALTYRARSSQETVATVRTAGSIVSITPRAKGTATITVTATDPGNLTATQQFRVTVRNRPPQPQGSIPATPPLDAGGAAHQVDVAAYFSDPDGDALTYRARSSQETVATVRTAGSIVSITPRAKGTATITVTAADPGGLRAEQTFDVEVRQESTPRGDPTPAAPVARGSIPDVRLSIGASAHQVDVAAYFSDPNGDALTYQARSSQETVATVRTAGSIVSITPRAKGTATITVTATDPGNLTATQQFRVTIRNRPPQPQGSIPATPPLDAGGAAHQVDVAAYFSDPDGDALTYRARSSQETVATVRTAGSTVSITPRAKGTATITVTATDPGNLTATQQFRVTVRNRPPQPQGSIPATPPLDAGGAAHQVDVAAYFSDPDGDALTYRARSSQETVATVRTAGSIVSITPRAKGTATITVTAADPGGLRAEQTFDVEVRQESTPRGDPTPAAPVARGSIPDVRLSIGASAHQVDVAAYFSDPNGDALTYQARSSQETVATVRTAGSTASITPRAKGTATITVTATDPGNLTATQQFRVTVRNRPPQPQGSIPAIPPLNAGDVAHAVDVAPYFSDPDGDTLTYAAESSNDLVATARAAGNTVSITPRAKGTATITVTAADQGDPSATQEFPVTVRPPAPLELLSLTVTGGSGSLYPALAADLRHYAVRCRGGTRLRVQAQASRTAATVTLLRAAASDNQAATGVLDASVAVSGDHDLVVELRQGSDTATYVVHCLPADFPEIRILKKTAAVAEGLLLVTPRSQLNNTYESIGSVSYMAILDNNGVPRFHRRLRPPGRNLRRLADGRYSLNSAPFVEIYDAQLRHERTVRPLAPLKDTDEHDFLITPEGNYLFIDYVPATRDECEVQQCEPDEKKPIDVRDSWIQEVTPGGTKVFEWNSWDHLKLSDCRFDLEFHRGEYAHLNSLELVGGDIVASFRHCSMVVRIDRSSGTGALVWQVGGSAPSRAAATRYLSISDDTTGQNEICGQHGATITGSGSLLVYDNGNLCPGPRKQAATFSRAVEYRLDTDKAVFLRQYRLPAGHGFSSTRGSVVELPNGNWLIAWGTFAGASLPYDQRLSISEVDPATGSSVFDVNMHSDSDRRYWYTYRVYRVPESAVQVPHNLP